LRKLDLCGQRLSTRPATAGKRLKELHSVVVVTFREVKVGQRNLEWEDPATGIDPCQQLLARRGGSFHNIEIARHIKCGFAIASPHLSNRADLSLRVIRSFLVNVKFDKLPPKPDLLRIDFDQLVQESLSLLEVAHPLEDHELEDLDADIL